MGSATVQGTRPLDKLSQWERENETKLFSGHR